MSETTRAEIAEMIRRAARENGLSLSEFVQQGEDGSLDDPLLRDYWLIWGDLIKTADLLPSNAA